MLTIASFFESFRTTRPLNMLQIARQFCDHGFMWGMWQKVETKSRLVFRDPRKKIESPRHREEFAQNQQGFWKWGLPSRSQKKISKLEGGGTRYRYNKWWCYWGTGSEETRRVIIVLQRASMKTIIPLSRSFMGIFYPYVT